MHPAKGLFTKNFQDSAKLSSNFITIVVLLLISSCSTSYKISGFFFTAVNNYFIAFPSINRSSTPLVQILILDSLKYLYLTKPWEIVLSLNLALTSAAYFFVVKKSLSAWRFISIVKLKTDILPHSKEVNKLYTKQNHSIYTGNVSNTVYNNGFSIKNPTFCVTD